MSWKEKIKQEKETMPKDANKPKPKPEENSTGQMILPTVTDEAKKRLEVLIPETKRLETQRMKITASEKENRKEINQILTQFGLENYTLDSKKIVDEFGDVLTGYKKHTTKISIKAGDAPSDRVEESSDDSGDDDE